MSDTRDLRSKSQDQLVEYATRMRRERDEIIAQLRELPDCPLCGGRWGGSHAPDCAMEGR